MEDALIYRGQVMHQRFADVGYRFRYRVFSLLLDVDRLDAVVRRSRLFSRNRFNLFSFFDADHLPPGDTDRRRWVERLLRDEGLDERPAGIRLLCFPRVLGMDFNPLSLWYCERDDGSPLAVVAEVRNTFGERHCYLLPAAAGSWPVRADHAKDFHVSPFIGMAARYDFRLSRPGDRLAVAIREFRDGELLLVATQTGERRPFTSRQLLLEGLRVPLQTLKVLAAIHWQALKIWSRGARFHAKPASPLKEVS